MSLFVKPDLKSDEALLAEIKEKMNYSSASSKYWKPKPHVENAIRVLPATGAGGNYHLKISKHFFRHDDRLEVFTCDREVYGKECPACEEWFRLLNLAKEAEKAGDKEKAEELKTKAKVFKPTRRGVFNIIPVEYAKDNERLVEEEATVMLYEAPFTVWSKIVALVTGEGRMADIFDEFKSDKGDIKTAGRDIIITYDPDQAPANRYNAYPTERVALGTPKQVLAWVEQITPLLPENVAREATPVIAQLKAFGSKSERDSMREMQKEMFKQQKADEKAEAEAEEEPKTTKSKVKKEEVVVDAPEGQVVLKNKTHAEEDVEVKAEVEEEVVQEEVVQEEVVQEEAGSALNALRAQLDQIKKEQD